ncbi:MAG: hypothetical protein IIB14_11505, partial [Chloroflexi bacterium]|nr:hypothetical protein [Chloroflexota bacterium]
MYGSTGPPRADENRAKAVAMLDESRAISTAVETCRGLDFAYSNFIVHRDLKPDNVL